MIVLVCSDPRIHSYTVDGLPTLKIQTLNQNDIGAHRRSVTLPTPLHLHRIRHGRTRPSNPPLGTKRVNYTEISLEEQYFQTDDLSGLTFKPVLVWKPRQKQSPLDGSPPGIRSKAVQSPDQSFHLVAADSVDAVGTGAPSCSQKMPTSREGARNSMTLFKTNLTDTLPPFRESPVKVH